MDKTTYPNGSIGYEYDKDGNIIKQKKNDSDAYSFAYDNSGNLGIIKDLTNNTEKRYIYNSSELLEKNVELAQKKYDMTQPAYNHGSKDFLTLQNAADSLMNAKISLMSQKITLLNTVLSLENTLGLPFGTLMNEESK